MSAFKFPSIMPPYNKTTAIFSHMGNRKKIQLDSSVPDRAFTYFVNLSGRRSSIANLIPCSYQQTLHRNIFK